MRSAIRVALQWVFAAAPRSARNLAIGQLAATLSAVGLVAFSALLFKRVLNDTHLGTLGVLWPLFAFAVLTSASSLITNVAAQRQRVVAERVEQHIWNQVLTTLEGVDLITYESEGFATHLARVEQNAVSRPLPTVRAVFSMLGAMMTAIAMGVALATFNPVLPVVLLGSAVPAVLIGRAASRTEFAFARRIVPLYMRRDYLRRVLGQREHAAEIRALGAFRILRPRHDQISSAMVEGLAQQVRNRTGMVVLSSLVAAVALILVLTGVVVLVDTGHLSLAEAGAAAIASRLFAAALTSAYTAYSSIIEAAPHIVDLEAFFALPVPPEQAGTRVGLDRELRLSEVGFTYPTATRSALEDIDFAIRRGEVVALVGENGSGKTTLARIVAGLYDADRGSIDWDGAPSVRLDRLESTSLLTQDFGRYALSVSENIAIGDSNRLAGVDAVEEAARLAHFDETAKSLPNGYDTMLGRDLDEGVDLSGGQWQRLALARALFRGGDLLILDEPSSALDPRTEAALFDDVREVLNGRSALLISHRYASARLADRIYVLHEGRIVESGTHVELMVRDGRYAELFRLQSASFLAGLSWQEQ